MKFCKCRIEAKIALNCVFRKFVQKSFRQKMSNHKAMFLLVKTRGVCETNTTPHCVRQCRSGPFSIYGVFNEFVNSQFRAIFHSFCVYTMVVGRRYEKSAKCQRHLLTRIGLIESGRNFKCICGRELNGVVIKAKCPPLA